MRRALTAVGVFLLVGLLFSTCGAANVIVIGVNAELTGSIPVVGRSCKNAAEMAADEVNKAGGLEVAGVKHQIRLIVEDNEDKPESAAAVAQKLISQNQVLALIGANASRNAIPAAQIAESAKVPMVSPWSTNVKTTQGKRYVFRACFIDDFQGVVCAKFARENLKAAKAAVLYDIASEYNKGIAEVFKRSFEQYGGRIVAFETYTTGDQDFSSQLTRIRQTDPEVLFLPNYYSEVPLQIQQARRLGYAGKFLGSDSWGFPDILKLGGADIEGHFFSTHYAPDIATPVAQQFIKAYEERFKEKPDDVAALTYDSFGMLFNAIKAAGKLDREAVRDALSKITSYEGVTGKMKFEGTGDPVKSAVFIQIKGGKFTYYDSVAP